VPKLCPNCARQGQKFQKNPNGSKNTEKSFSQINQLEMHKLLFLLYKV
jgi:hypothetical protein